MDLGVNRRVDLLVDDAYGFVCRHQYEITRFGNSLRCALQQQWQRYTVAYNALKLYTSLSTLTSIFTTLASTENCPQTVSTNKYPCQNQTQNLFQGRNVALVEQQWVPYAFTMARDLGRLLSSGESGGNHCSGSIPKWKLVDGFAPDDPVHNKVYQGWNSSRGPRTVRSTLTGIEIWSTVYGPRSTRRSMDRSSGAFDTLEWLEWPSTAMLYPGKISHQLIWWLTANSLFEKGVERGPEGEGAHYDSMPTFGVAQE
ncbi:hypothetical protein C8R45DRAFT_928680 [Mycena sanguinolenta]|nr:hypothetical protein C8R45DRAFT_928680 [Mycena sanguinolenta]